MVVTDDNFASIVAAVEEGRGIFDNIRKFVHYLLSCNTSEILVMFFGLLFGLPLPLLPIQILWVNLVTDSFPALALGMDPVNPKVMSQPARPKNEPVILASNSGLMLLQGLFMALCTLAAFIFFLRVNVTAARSAAFFVLATSQLFHAFNCRDQRISIFKLGLFSNLKLVAATLFSFALLLLAFYTPWLQVVFKTTPFIGAYLLMLFIISSLPLIGMEAVKLALCRK
jgi:Ca2+-transporting ATPase